MKTILTYTIALLLFSCEQTEKKPDRELNTIEIGDYLFDFPPDFKLVKEMGIDSYVGEIIGDSMRFVFDFGYYSNSFELTPQDYLDKGHWQFTIPYQFMEEGITYDHTNTPKVDIISIRPATNQDSTLGKGCDYVAKCIHNNTEFDFAIYLPGEIKRMNFAIDTIDNQYRKIVWTKAPYKGKTGIYIKDLDGFNESINGYLSLTMATTTLTSEQQEMALKIFKTGRHKQNKTR